MGTVRQEIEYGQLLKDQTKAPLVIWSGVYFILLG